MSAALKELDPELWISALKEMADFYVLGSGREIPEGYQTEDGIVWYDPHGGADGERVRAILDAERASGSRHVWRLVWGAMSESAAEIEAWARRWKAARLNDLGFPDHPDAMRVYRPLEVEDAPVVDVGAEALASRMNTY